MGGCMFEVVAIIVGSMTAIFCGYKFATNHLTKKYSGLFDLAIRAILVLGVLSSGLLMPILLQKSRFPDINIGIFLIGTYLGFALCGISAWLEKKGILRWPKNSK